ncbi:class I SAM-dependent methyltransferase [Alkalihalobacillus sp. AL-G]|uniref:class I SAM-dependent methyltransferase n=1 Tax=Alkalihalobacillus sp. AL-G TaxID=2926399 RepID=UPI00272A9151|nr:class I SAM-dependent methyltransferase [Alkalihalobacillus sp. AL-G]WLD94605.1 class I SAM-dependent methyltransferase [Alkalihalobacillus sp. AL-G]
MGTFKKFKYQFQKPEGLFGRLAGTLMASVGFEKNVWTVSLLELSKDDNVLEVGFGPGTAIQLAARKIKEGKVVGIDYSEVMLQQAQKRNKQSIQEGKVQLKIADVNDSISFDLRFDKVFSVNSIIFWEDPVETLKRIRQFMNPDGVIALTVQPFIKGATEETSKQFGNEIAKHLKQAEFSDIRVELKELKPVPTVCVLGINR